MQNKIINLLTELLADQTESEVRINEVKGTHRLGSADNMLDSVNHGYADKPTMGKTVGGAKC